jgi:hypothetical protein
MIDGVDVTGPTDVDASGDWQLWTTLAVGDVELSPGTRVVRVVFDSGGVNLDWIEFAAAGADDGDPPGATPLPGDAKVGDGTSGISCASPLGPTHATLPTALAAAALVWLVLRARRRAATA